MKIVKMLAILLIFLSTFHMEKVYAADDNNNELIIDEQMNSGEVKKIENQLKKYSQQGASELIIEYDPQKLIKDITKGNFGFSLKGILWRTVRFLFEEIYININILIKLMVLVVLCAILRNLQSSFLSESVGELAFYACYVVLVSVIMLSFSTSIGLARDIIDSMVSFMQATVPVLITLLVSGGNITSAGIFQPVLIMIVEVAATIIKNVFIPLIFLATVLSIVNNISDKLQISKLAGFLKQIGGWALGIILTVFIAVISIQGSLGAVVDGVASKTAKFAISTFIPVAGKILADAADAVVGCSLLIKNAAGVAVMIGIIAMCLVPLLKMLALIALYRITCVLIEPVSEKRITNCINDIADSMTFLIGIVASVAFMFLISITAIISAGNISAMIR